MPNVAEVKKRTNGSNVLTLRRRNLGSFAHTIYQEDLEAILIARAEIKKAAKKLEEKEEYVAAALRGGARIEPGLHSAELIPVDRKGFRVKACAYFRLAVRLLLFALTPLSCLAQSAPGAANSPSLIRTQEMDGGSVVTDLSMGIKVNAGSSLRRRWFVMNSENCPAQISSAGVRSVYKPTRYSGDYYFEAAGGIRGSKPIAAFEVRFILFDVWGEHSKTLSMTQLGDIPAGTVFDLGGHASWRAYENDVERLFTVAAFISHVRFADGTTWNFDLKQIAAEIARLRLQSTEQDLAPERPAKGDAPAKT